MADQRSHLARLVSLVYVDVFGAHLVRVSASLESPSTGPWL